MEQVQSDDVVSTYYRGPDRRRGGILGRVERLTIRLVRSRWVAMFAIATAVSWGFHVVEKRSDDKIESQQRVTVCVIDTVARQQPTTPIGQRISVSTVLQQCQKHKGK